MICIIVILGENLLNGWCRMRMRPARLVSYAFLYTTWKGKVCPGGGKKRKSPKNLFSQYADFFLRKLPLGKENVHVFHVSNCYSGYIKLNFTSLLKIFLLNFGKVFKFMNVFHKVFSTEKLVNINNFKF